MALTREEILHIASLARIGIKNEEEIAHYQQDLSSVLDYFVELASLDTDTVEPIGHITGMENVSRRDESVDFGQQGKEAIVKNAPETKDGFIKVKSVL